MARTRAADYDDRRQIMIDRAAELFAETGYLGSSMAEIAESCGLSKSLIYHYFGSKEQILFETMQDHVSALAAAAAAIVDDDPAKALADLTHRFLALYRDAAAKQKVLVNDLRKLPEPRRRQIIDEERKLIEQVSGFIAGINPEVGADAVKLRASTMLYFGMINWTHTWFDARGPMNSEALAELVLDLFLGGLSPGRSGAGGERPR